jgi:HPr kinase/phosphorylase
MIQIHATAIALASRAVLLLGPSGSGKSRMALSLIRCGAWLVADDRTILAVKDGALVASCPPAIQGKLEVRGLGIVGAPVQSEAPVRLCLLLDPAERPEPEAMRMPEIRPWTPPTGLNNSRPIPCVPFDAFRPDAAEAVIAALAHLADWEDSPPSEFAPVDNGPGWPR